MAKQISSKRLAISKANAQMVGVIAAASFITVFCLVASNAVFSQYRYQAKVVNAKEKAKDQLNDNAKNFEKLKQSYKAFDASDPNKIGGTISGSGDKDGRNSRIVLDALPGSYDFPALASSLEKILTDRNLKVTSITGTDDEVNQKSNSSSTNPEPIEVPFSFSIGDANYTSVQELIKALEQSIRPIHIDKIDISGGEESMTITVDAHTYFQPSKSLDVTTKVVK